MEEAQYFPEWATHKQVLAQLILGQYINTFLLIPHLT